MKARAVLAVIFALAGLVLAGTPAQARPIPQGLTRGVLIVPIEAGTATVDLRVRCTTATGGMDAQVDLWIPDTTPAAHGEIDIHRQAHGQVVRVRDYIDARDLRRGMQSWLLEDWVDQQTRWIWVDVVRTPGH